MQEKLKEIRIYLCLAILLSGVMPWLKIVSEAEGGEAVSAQTAISITGFGTFSYSILGILVFILPVVLAVIEFIPDFNIKLSPFYIISGILGIIISFLTYAISKGAAIKAQSTVNDIGSDFGVDVECNAIMQAGFYVAIISFLVMIVYTLIKDYAISKDSLKEKGIKELISTVASDVGSEITEIVESNTCPNCGANVIIGKKFCTKCGGQMSAQQPKTDIENKPVNKKSGDESVISKLPIGKSVERGVKSKNMITVNEYIKTLKSINCHKCNEEAPITSKFCPNCGESILIKIYPDTCSNCGEKLIKGRNFCTNCGTKSEGKELITNCKKCNADLIYGKAFCADCGAKVE